MGRVPRGDFTNATSATVTFVTSRIPGLSGGGWRVSGTLAVTHSRSDGEIVLSDASITGSLILTGATIRHPGELALNLDGVACADLLLPAHVDGCCDLRHAQVGTLYVPNVAEQPPTRLAGLTYTTLDLGDTAPVHQQIAWLHRDPDGFHPQPYEQLAAYHRGAGNDRDARRVLLAKHRARRRHVPRTWRLPRLLRPLHPALAAVWQIPGWLYDGLSGYGYVPWRAVPWLLAASATGALTLRDVAASHPTDTTWINAVLLGLDATLPTHPLGVHDPVSLTGEHHLVALALRIVGYAVVLSVIPAVIRAVGRHLTGALQQ